MRNYFRHIGFALILLVSAVNATPPVTICQLNADYPGLVALYHMNEGTGALVADATGNNPGTLQGSTHWSATGKFGSSYNFDVGTALDYVLITTANVAGTWVWGNAPRTLMAWFQYTSTTTPVVIFGYGGGDGSAGYEYYILANAASAQGRVGVEWNGGTWYVAKTVDGGWHHLAAVFPSGGTKGSHSLLYYDGVLQSGALDSSDSTIATKNSGYKPAIGTLARYTPLRFEGKIDECAFFNRALSATEISKIYYSNPRSTEE